MYRVNEIFYSLQGEGRWMGRPAVFLRMSGCNLRCPFCDTDFKGYKEMTAEEIADACAQKGGECQFIVITGGEPTLQVDATLTQTLHAKGFYLAMETNGTHPIPEGIDWVTCSPKGDFTEGGAVDRESRRAETGVRRQPRREPPRHRGNLLLSATLRRGQQREKPTHPEPVHPVHPKPPPVDALRANAQDSGNTMTKNNHKKIYFKEWKK